MLLSLFCGVGGLDLGFESAGFEIALAFDKSRDSVDSYNYNRQGRSCGHVRDITELTLEELDKLNGSEFRPVGVIGGPPCQGFSRANTVTSENDPRNRLARAFSGLIGRLNARNPIDFLVFENVPDVRSQRFSKQYDVMKEDLEKQGFQLAEYVLNALHYGTPQHRERVFVVGLNQERFGGKKWRPPKQELMELEQLTVQHTIGGLPEPMLFQTGLQREQIPVHPNHWCMVPRSPKFSDGTLSPGNRVGRSFKTLSWDQPSYTVAYGNREVHVHPSCCRRLSVYEAMLLQGFPREGFELLGNLSSQINQISEAVPPPLAEAVAQSIADQLLLGVETKFRSEEDAVYA